MSTTFQIAEVAQRSESSAATLRSYEGIGLLAPARRTDAGYRLYDETSLKRLRFIARAKRLGCSLDEIADLSTAWDGGRRAPVQERLRAADLQHAAATLSAGPVDGPCDDTCGCTTETTASPAGPISAAVPLIAKADATVPTEPGEVPIACTLGAGEMCSRRDEWNTLLGNVTARRPLDDGRRLEFRPDTDVTEIARLTTAEQGCCRFLDFALVIDSRGVALGVHAPPDGQPVLAALFGEAS